MYTLILHHKKKEEKLVPENPLAGDMRKTLNVKYATSYRVSQLLDLDDFNHITSSFKDFYYGFRVSNGNESPATGN